uniref:Uncharacterized protein n=1 Tax=Anguilla anguilla TaxID=7936 RepID=A0A0E9THB9_ANGAN
MGRGTTSKIIQKLAVIMQFTVGAFRHSEVSILDYKFITEKGTVSASIYPLFICQNLINSLTTF